MSSATVDVAPDPDVNQPAWPRPLVMVAMAAGTGIGSELLLHPFLVDGSPPGLGLSLAATLFAVVMLVGTRPQRWPALLAGGGTVVAWLVSLRASPVLAAANVTSAGLLLGAAAWSVGRSSLATLTLRDYGRAALETAGHAVGGGVGALRREVGPVLARVPRPAGSGAVIRGLLLAAAPLALFTALFISADEVFASFVGNLTSIQLGPGLVQGAAIAALLAWTTLGLLWFASRTRDAETVARAVQRIGTTEILSSLLALNALFAVFAGSQLVQWLNAVSLPDYDFSAYARRGFFELVWVAALVILIVLTADWVIGASGPRETRRIHRAAMGLISLTGFVLAGAIYRMVLYVQELGLTELRFYTTAFMVWVAIVLVWSWLTVLRQRRRYFAVGAAAAALTVVVALNLVNPDAVIAETNLTRASDHPVDITYLTSALSADATPALVDHVARVADPCQRALLASSLLDEGTWRHDWRSANFGRFRADRAVAKARPHLRSAVESCSRILDTSPQHRSEFDDTDGAGRH